MTDAMGDFIWLELFIIPSKINQNEDYKIIARNITDFKEAKIRSREINSAKIEQRVKEQQYRSVLILEGQEEERQRLGREIHDGLGQMLTALKLSLESLTPDNSIHTKKRLTDTKELLKSTLREVRRLAFNLTPTSLSVTTQQDEQLLEGELAGHRCVAGHCFWQLEEDAEGGRVLEVYLEKETPGEQWRALLQLADGEREKQEPDTTPTARSIMDLQLGDAPAVQRVEVELFGRCCPRTAENFVLLCERGEGEGFKGAPFHRVIPKFVAQGGDFTARDGTGGRAALEGIGGGPNF